MSFPRDSWTPWPPPWPSVDPNGLPSLHMILGRLLERSEHTADQVDKIASRQEDIETRQLRIEATLDAQQKAPNADRPGPWEGLIKDTLRWALPFVALWWTGHLEVAVELLKAKAG